MRTSNHPNRGKRGKRGPYSSPYPDEITSARESHYMSTHFAAELLCCTERALLDMEAGLKPMHPGLWRLLCEHTGWPWPPGRGWE